MAGDQQHIHDPAAAEKFARALGLMVGGHHPFVGDWQVKGLYAAIEGGDEKTAATLLKRNIKHIQRISGKGIIHKNQSARRCSRLHKAYNKAFAQA